MSRTTTRRRPGGSPDAPSEVGPSGFVEAQYGDEAITSGRVASIADALQNGVTVSFYMIRGDASPMFRLRGYRGVVHVVDPQDRHLGTFADIAAAEERGWHFGFEMGVFADGAGEVGTKGKRRARGQGA